ncbi:quaternary amine ABC transporter ATP-binding protein [Desulfobaculum bizertense]|uniref:Glycine betaine/proline transport system ATP-binding protein n=1 Tax=Desulfobaculum bizertense DSM 18034 TaxID=1121442 RepID=A0A1T4VJY0_9BACT|nr:glycine betaine/L-proline ABC transporter ATP-binding protein [Desulfobaculum bizertense]UIJ38039.1 glycine betaine/L-proline ABC transporter ATP-binding protein [Desulfobaculum bizertense]SKA65233.1 glycine betaine/proline transport system ATP-binding protein [Desulfobaculum bizertense DSM 18034]
MDKVVVENVCKIFGSHPERGLDLLNKGQGKQEIFEKTKLSVGVDNASFTVKEGEIVVIMGLSGSGKSTLVRCINRLVEPTSGHIFIDGQDITDLSANELRLVRQQKLGMVFQKFALFPHRTVRENVEFGLEVQGVSLGERRKKAREALDRVGLGQWAKSRPSDLSGGMQQRVGLARALASDPDILLMDEAFSALDPLIRRDMQDELIELQKKLRKTIIFISHDLDEALKLGDRIVLMKDGRIVQVGTPEDILTSPANDYVERFVEDVDITKVLTAENVMKKSETVAFMRSDGPRTALRKMRANNISSIFVLDHEHRVLGLLSADVAAKLAERGDKTLDAADLLDVQTVSPDAPASELFNMMYESSLPVAVVTPDHKLMGVIIKGLLLGAVAERGGLEDWSADDAVRLLRQRASSSSRAERVGLYS